MSALLTLLSKVSLILLLLQQSTTNFLYVHIYVYIWQYQKNNTKCNTLLSEYPSEKERIALDNSQDKQHQSEQHCLVQKFDICDIMQELQDIFGKYFYEQSIREKIARFQCYQQIVKPIYFSEVNNSCYLSLTTHAYKLVFLNPN